MKLLISIGSQLTLESGREVIQITSLPADYISFRPSAKIRVEKPARWSVISFLPNSILSGPIEATWNGGGEIHIGPVLIRIIAVDDEGVRIEVSKQLVPKGTLPRGVTEIIEEPHTATA